MRCSDWQCSLFLCFGKCVVVTDKMFGVYMCCGVRCFDRQYKGKVFYGQEPPCGESTTTEFGVNYQLLAVITEVAQWGTLSCSRPQPAMDNAIRDGRCNWLVAPPPPSWGVPPEVHILHSVNAANKLQDLLQQLGLERTSMGMPDQCTTGAATQGICLCLYVLVRVMFWLTMWCSDWQCFVFICYWLVICCNGKWYG